MTLLRAFLLWPACCLLAVSAALADAASELMLAKKYREDIDATKYFVSEKLDGVRARWNGEQLISRGGHSFAAPGWFVAGFPDESLDGELWIGRKQYENTSSIVSRFEAHEGWRRIRFMIFDMPNHGGMFMQRVDKMREIVNSTSSPYLALIDQNDVSDNKALMQLLEQVVEDGGEGLMLHRKTARYKSGRSHDLLKLKRFDDAEAIVKGYKAGTGKYEGMTGSLKVEDKNRKTFFIGSGLSDAQRRNPPAIGSTITFRHQGVTKNGIPRFPVFMRVRSEEPQVEQ